MPTSLRLVPPIPHRFRWIGLWIARCLFVAVLALILALVTRVLLTLHANQGHWLFYPRSLEPMSPDFISYRPTEKDHSRRVCAD